MENAMKWIKGAVKSVTMWFNGVAVAFVLAAPEIINIVPQMKPYLTDARFEQTMLVVLIGNILLRVKTKSSLKDKTA